MPPSAAQRLKQCRGVGIAIGLRLNEGVAWKALTEEFAHDQVAAFEPVVRDLCELGLLHVQDGIVRLTRRGVLFSNEVFARFLAEQQELIEIQ